MEIFRSSQKRKQTHSFKRSTRLITDFPTLSMEVKRQQNYIFAALRENKTVNLEILHPVKIAFKNERKIKTLPGK